MDSNKTNTVTKKEELPEFEQILSGNTDILSLSPDAQKNFVIVYLDKRSKTVAIFGSLEEKARNEKDFHQFYMTQIQRCKAKGLVNIDRNYRYTSRALINYIYNKNSELSDGELKEDVEGLRADFDSLLYDAMQANTSDIHIEVRRNEARIKFRINGAIVEHTSLTSLYAEQMATVIYQSIAEEKDTTFIKSKPQDAVIDRVVNNSRIRVRVATIPAYPDGFDMIMRLLPISTSECVITLADLGYLQSQLEDINLGASKPVGVIIIAGGTGSGKSTSLTTILSQKLKESAGEKKCITIEDPPEYVIAGATQSPVVRSKGGDGKEKNPFIPSMRAALRSDPDIIMVGEVRDKDTAELLVHAVQSGHQVFTTLHASSAFGILPRLRNMGVKNDILGSPDFLSTLIRQTLAKTTCPSCSESYADFIRKSDLTEKQNELLGRLHDLIPDKNELKDIRFLNKSGCEHCRNGIVGRTVIAEVVTPDEKMLSYISEARDDKARRHFRKNGGELIHEVGIKKMLSGIIDPFEIEDKLGRMDIFSLINDDSFDDEDDDIKSSSSSSKAKLDKEDDVIIVEDRPDDLFSRFAKIQSDKKEHTNPDNTDSEV